MIWPLFRKMAANQKQLNQIGIFWYQFTPRKLLYLMISVNLVNFGPHWLSGFFLATLYIYIYIAHIYTICIVLDILYLIFLYIIFFFPRIYIPLSIYMNLYIRIMIDWLTEVLSLGQCSLRHYNVRVIFLPLFFHLSWITSQHVHSTSICLSRD